MSNTGISIPELMLMVRERKYVWYHRDTKQFDFSSYSAEELANASPKQRIKMGSDRNSIPLPSFEEIDHKDIMRYYVKDCVEDPDIRKQLFHILRRNDFMDAFLDKLRELYLYDEFLLVAGDIYDQLFYEWAEKNEISEYMR